MAIFTMMRSFIAMKLNKIRSRETILYLQNKKFRKMLKHAYRNSKFYRDLYNSHNITEKDLDTIDIEKLPIINKELLYIPKIGIKKLLAIKAPRELPKRSKA